VNHRTKLYNFRNGGDPEYCGYYRIDLHSGSAAVDTPFVGSDIPNIDKTFAHGIRNSFRLIVDPFMEMFATQGMVHSFLINKSDRLGI
jgi:aldose sugar dehydrogenase